MADTHFTAGSAALPGGIKEPPALEKVHFPPFGSMAGGRRTGARRAPLQEACAAARRVGFAFGGRRPPLQVRARCRARTREIAFLET